MSRLFEDPKTKAERHELIKLMLKEVEKHWAYTFNKPNDFLANLRTWFNATGDLSEKQVEALKKFYERV